MKKYLLFCLALGILFLPFQYVKGQNDEQPVGGRRAGLGFAYTAVQGDVWALFANPACITGMKSAQAGLYMERRFMLSQMNYGAMGFATPFKETHYAGFDIGSFGFGSYSESRIGLTYATILAEKFSLGAKVNYTLTSIQNYGSAGAIHFDVGFHAIVTKNISVGFRAYNVSQSKISRPLDEKLPSIFSFGGCYKFSEKALLVADIQKHVDYPLSFRGGIEYFFSKHLVARAGVSTAPVNFTAGVGITTKNMMIDFASSYHQQLGYTPHLSLKWNFGGDKK